MERPPHNPSAPPQSPKFSKAPRPVLRPGPERRTAPVPKKAPRRGKKPFELWQRPDLELQTTTLWDYPSQHYGVGEQGSKHYVGATPSYVIWNVLQRYTHPGDSVLDPMCGSGTTLDVCEDTRRHGIGFDLAPFRPDIRQGDARHMPLKNNVVDCVFLDPPYSTHVEYSDHGKCIGKLDARTPAYYAEMDAVFKEMFRLMKPGAHIAVYVSDSFKKGKPFCALGFELFALLRERFEPIDVVCVTRHHQSLKKGNWHEAAAEGNFFLRGFNYLLIFQKRSRRNGR